MLARLIPRQPTGLARIPHLSIRHASHTVFQKLRDVSDLSRRAGSVNRKADKQAIIAEYPHLRPLLELVLAPRVRFGMTSSNLRQFLESGDTSRPLASDLELEQLFDQLAERRITGGEAKRTVGAFVQSFVGNAKREDGSEPTVEEMEDAYDAFYSLIDRDLGAGFSSQTLAAVPWPASSSSSNSTKSSAPSSSAAPADTTPSATPLSAATKASPSPNQSAPGSSQYRSPRGGDSKAYGKAQRSLVKFECALGKSITPPFEELQKRSQTWYASRKLDGVRVLALIDFYVPHDPSHEIEYDSVDFVSRSGSSFRSLAKLEMQVQHLARYPNLRAVLDADPVIIEEVDGGVLKRLVLDGEVCVMVPAKPNETVRTFDDGSGASALWESDGMVEDFSQAVSAVKRYETMREPLYFLFDSLSWAEVENKGAVNAPGLGKTFGERVKDTKALVEWLKGAVESSGEDIPRVRALQQLEVKVQETEGMIERAASEGWEGLIFRADLPYKGKRSTDIRKFKEFQDAEYTVIGLETSQQRLPVDGEYASHEAMSNVWIEHKGNRISVGSGFTPKERIRFSEDPSLIVGKQITVEYFSESEAIGKPGLKSLRFPRVKAIWTEGKRSI